MNDNLTPSSSRVRGRRRWRVLGDGANAYFRTGSYAAARARSGRSVSCRCQRSASRHRPPTRRSHSALLKISDDYAGMTRGIVELARGISGAARSSASPQIVGVQSLLVYPGATDRPGVMPFLARRARVRASTRQPGEDLVDPRVGRALLVRADERAAR